jgi:hypothetical protein
VNELDAFVHQVVEQIRSSVARKAAMREELLGHLSEAYEEELSRCGDPKKAMEQVRKRFGDAGTLHHELQAVVPWAEQFSAVVRKEILMRKWFWVVAWMVMIVVMMFLMPERDFRQDLVFVGIVGALGVLRLSQKPNSITKWLGPRWGWRAIGVLFGVGVILPALAQLKHGARSGMEVGIPVALGTVMVLIGIVTFGDALRRQMSRAGS